MGDDKLDVGGVTMKVSGDDLTNALLPHVVKALLANGAFRSAMVQALMPDIVAQMATLSRSTGGAGTTTPRIGSAT
jgi:hypothetical protein